MDKELTTEQKAALEKDISAIQKWIKKTISITKNELINSTNQIFKNLIIDIDESSNQIKNNSNNKDELNILHEKLQAIENEKKQLFQRNENLTKRLEESTKRNISEIQSNFDTKFQKQAENLVQENSDLKIEILNLKNKISSLTATPVDFEATGDGDVFSELQNHFNHLAQEKENLQNQLSIEKQNAEVCKNKTDLARAENENLTILMDIMKSEYNELNQQISDYRQDFQDYERKIQDANKELQASQDIIKELKNKNRSLSNEIENKVTNESENIRLKTEKEKLQSEKTDLLNLIDDFNRKQLDDKNQLSALESKVYNYEKAISEKDITINDLKSQNQEMTNKVNQMKNQLLENYNEKEMLLKNQENSQKEIDLLKQNANVRSTKLIDGLNKQISDLMETQRALYSQIEYQQIEATAHKSQIENLENQLAETSILLKNTNDGEKFESFSKKLEEMKTENEALHKKLIQNQDQMNKISEIETLKSVNKTLRQSQNELKSELVNVKKELLQCTSEISSLKAQNNDITIHLEQLKPENVSLREKQQQLIKISQNVQESNRDLTRQNIEKEKKNKYLNERISKLNEELSLLKTRNEELESILKKRDDENNDEIENEDEDDDEDVEIIERNVKKREETKKNDDSKNSEKITKLLNDIAKIKEEKKALRSRLLKIINMCKSLQKEKAEFVQEKEQLTQEIGQLQTDYMAINEKNSKLTTDNQKLRKKNLKLIVYAKNLKKTRKELTEQINKLNGNNNKEGENENEDVDNDKENENKNENKNKNKNENENKNENKGTADQSVQVNFQEDQFHLAQEEEDIDEIRRLNDKLNSKIIEIDKIKRQHKKEIKKLQKENNKLKAKQEEMQEKIKKQPSNHNQKNDNDISEIKEAQTSELHFQNDALKKQIELQAQNYELDILDLQTEIAQKDQEIKQLQENLMNNSEDNTEMQQLKAKNADLQSQLSHLMQDRNRAGSRRGFYLDSSTANNFDDFELKAQKFKDVLMRQFTQINLRVKSLDSKISFLKYRLKLKRNNKEILVIPKSLYSVMQLLGVKKRTKRPNLEQISDDLYKALRKKEDYSENESAFESLADVMHFDSSNERDILEEACRQFKYLKSIEIKFKNTQNIIDNIRRLIEKETDNDDFADTVRLLFVSNNKD